MDIDDFVDYAETESIVSKARVSEELESLCSSIGGEIIKPEKVDWPLIAARLEKSHKVTVTGISGSQGAVGEYQKYIKHRKPNISVRIYCDLF